MKNIEFKVRVAALDDTLQHARELGAQDHSSRIDVDTYFRVLDGRLKLRVAEGATSGTLIWYQRPDAQSSRISDYRLVPVAKPGAMHDILAEALGVLVTIKKSRQLLLYGATRIHLDQVEQLGSFVELETVLGAQTLEEAHAEHDLVRNALHLAAHEIIPVSYSDLLLRAE